TKPKTKVPNSALHSRASYLHQAARYLASQSGQNEGCGKKAAGNTNVEYREPSPTPNILGVDPALSFQPNARLLVSNLRNVCGKVLIRMSPDMKQSICKNCDSILIDGRSCSIEIENKSNGGMKPWADVLVRTCVSCGYAKRIPLGERQKRRTQRS
ncbi:RNAse P Rpr2/Rpp21/SNM1 subunit domain-containing protein, partial [Bisporella sp. PMI_857]